MTTNPSIFAKAITGGTAYDDQVADLAARGVHVGEALRTLTTFDVRWACDVLRPVYDATDGVDGRVSIEVDPRLAHDTRATVAEARALWWAVDRPNLFIKIPAVRQGLPAITACLAEGISTDVTLIFSLSRYQEVMAAFLDGLEQAQRAGHDLARLGSVASFFVSRVDTEVDARLDKIGVPGVVNTMPEATLRAVAAHGVIPTDSVRGRYEQAQHVFDRLADVGVGYEDIVTRLEREGMSKFDSAWEHLGQQVATRLVATIRHDQRVLDRPDR